MSTPTSWTTADSGSIGQPDDPEYPAAVELTSGSPRLFSPFSPEPLPSVAGNRIRFSIRGSDYHLLYLEMLTTAGRR